MKIAFVAQPIDTVLPPYQNSVGACAYGAACSLAQSNQVTVYGLADRHADAGPVLSHRGVQFRFVPATASDRLLFALRNKLAKIVQLSSPLSTWSWLFPGYGRRVAQELAKEEFDVIHVQHCSQYVPLIRKLNPRAKIDLQLHAEWFSQCKPAALAARLRGLDLLTSVSDHITEKTRRDVPSLANRCATVYNGIDSEEFAAEKDYQKTAGRPVKRIMYAGGVSPHKGIHVLLDAFRMVVERYPHVQLDIIGPQGSYPLEETFDLNDRESLAQVQRFYTRNFFDQLKRKLVRSAAGSQSYLAQLEGKLSDSMAGKVSFLGMIPRPDLVAHYYEADLFVFPPVWDEGFGIPPVEAMAAGTAVVASRSGAVVETVLHEETGLLVPKNDAQALASAMLRLLADDSLRERMGRAGRVRALQHFTWDQVARKMEQEYQALCSSPAATRLSSMKQESTWA
jgi:glycosyltransferase involved in cell wall biosynthesis